MIGAVVENIIGGYLHPRASVRRLLDAGHGLDVALTMVVLAFLVREIFFIVTPGARHEMAGLSLGQYFLSLVDALITFAVFSVAICYVGRVFGGKGTFRQTGLVLAWYLLVTSAIVPLVLPAVLRIVEAAEAAGAAPAAPVALPAGAALIVLVGSGVLMWLFASYVAELHRFARTWSVLAAIIGLSIPFSMIASALLPPFA
ncbi:MAG: YIP1 family protein [Thermohalobaculum sp.]